MTFPSCARPPPVACAESIALLHFLNPVPTQPSENPVERPFPCITGNYTLAFLEERNLTSALAFLSSIEDDPNHVCAVAILEAVKSRSLNVLIAVNKARRDDGDHVLQRLKDHFEGIFSQLCRAPDGE